MNERPILFSGPMIRAILEGRKTQTRRVVKPQPTEQVYNIYRSANFAPRDPLDDQAPDFNREIHCPYGAPGDRLWVRETWMSRMDGETELHYGEAIYKASLGDVEIFRPRRWRPSIHMPRWASRIALELTGVRVERLHKIGEMDAKAEGVDPKPVVSVDRGESYLSYCEAFSDLWDEINAKRGHDWASNPYVWVLEFRRIA